MLLGSLALTAGCVALTVSPGLLLTHHTGACRLALLHVFTLGFVGLVFAGTLQQLPAVMFVARLAWPGLGYLSSPLLLVGSALVIAGFAAGFTPLPLAAGGLTVTLGWVLLLAQLLATALRRWPRDAGSQALLLSVLFLTLTVAAGFLLAGARTSPAFAGAVGYRVRLHLMTSRFGAFLLGIFGSVQKMLAMFALLKGVRWV